MHTLKERVYCRGHEGSFGLEAVLRMLTTRRYEEAPVVLFDLVLLCQQGAEMEI
jgi:hypothetical protein